MSNDCAQTSSRGCGNLAELRGAVAVSDNNLACHGTISLLRCGMVKSTGIYQGDYNCQLTHGPSGQLIETDAPKDNHGRGLAFSPTDLFCASLGSCMVTTMAIAAKNRLGFDLTGAKWEVTKEMSNDAPRRIARITTTVWLPIPRTQDPEGVLERAGLACPVKKSLSADVDTPIIFHWAE
ncbi:MAG: OsmC family protein [Candidatus Didemnitutus sp.]|nr:OsmC family protein [Candidatus Didemnitutus sp.]